MSQENDTVEQAAPAPAEKPAAAAPTAPAAKKPTGTLVTSTVTLDFPSLDWGIHAGEERELPADQEAAAAILSNPYITKV